MFQHAVQPPMEVEPAERPFHLPPLAAIAPVMNVLRGAAARNGDRVLTIRGEGNNAPLAQGPAVRFAIIAFVQPQAVRFALTLADANTVDRLQQCGAGVAGGFPQGEVEGVTIGVDDQMAFQPFNPVFSGVSDFLVRPFLAFTTRAL